MPDVQAAFRLYDLNGTLLHEQLGRGQYGGQHGFRQGTGSRYWWSGALPVCPSTRSQGGAAVQRLTARGDTLPAWPRLAPVPPSHCTTALLEDGRYLVLTGFEDRVATNNYQQRYTLTSVDTATGQVRWRRVYDRLPAANDYPVDLVRTPRGGYLISGDGQLFSGFQHLLLETDSLGNLRKQRLIYPLGPGYGDGLRYVTWSNLVALPNAQGYLASGTADSVVSNLQHYQRGYVMRLDTALNVTWVYAHLPALDGQLSQDANRLRLLPDGSVALLLRDMRGTRNSATASLRLIQIDLATGRLLSRYALPSATQSVIRLFDWQWVGDGTLVLCGATQPISGGVTQGYLARWDFRGTPLATGRPATAAAGAALRLYPLPATPAQPATAHYQLPPGTSGGATLLVTDVLGRPVLRHALPSAPRTGALPLPALPPGLYLVRLVPERGPALTQRLLVQP